MKLFVHRKIDSWKIAASCVQRNHDAVCLFRSFSAWDHPTRLMLANNCTGDAIRNLLVPHDDSSISWYYNRGEGWNRDWNKKVVIGWGGPSRVNQISEKISWALVARCLLIVGLVRTPTTPMTFQVNVAVSNRFCL
jgi:hypothetical protein